MLVDIKSFINELQAKNLFPSGRFDYISWEQSYSYIIKVSINNEIFFIKKVKLRTGFTENKLKLKLRREYKVLLDMYDYFKSSIVYQTPEVVYFSEKKLVLITRGLNGDLLRDVINNSIKHQNYFDLHTEMERTGSFLKQLHGKQTIEYSIEDLKSLMEYIKERLLDKIFSKNDELKLTEYLIRAECTLYKELDSYKKSFIHCDFFPTNILISPQSINVIDFGESKQDHLFFDLIYFKVMLYRQLNTPFKKSKIDAEILFKSFCKGYDLNFEKILNDKLYCLYSLKVLSIFISSLKVQKNSFFCIRDLKNKFSNLLELYYFKKMVLEILNS